MNDLGNTAFMIILSAFAVIAVTGIAILGFSAVSLALLIICIPLGIIFGLRAENALNRNRKKKLQEQDFDLWPDDTEDHINKD